MASGNDLLTQAIAALQSGDRVRAHTLLTELVEQQPDNEQGWYYLAATERDPAVRKQQLERVLAINPDNAKAREVLERIKSAEVRYNEGEGFEVQRNPNPPTAAEARRGDRPARLRQLDPNAGPKAGAAESAADGFKLPFNIPGAPEYISLSKAAQDGLSLVRIGWEILIRRSGDYGMEVDRATWWRYWLLLVTAAAMSAGLSFILALYFQIRFSSSLFNVIAVLLTPVLTIPIIVASFFIGCYASYRYAQSQGWNATLIRHSMTAAIVFAPALVFQTALSFILNLLGFGGGGILTLVFAALLAGYYMGEGYTRLYVLSDDPQKKYSVPAITLLVMLVAIVVFRIILGGLIIGSALPFTF